MSAIDPIRPIREPLRPLIARRPHDEEQQEHEQHPSQEEEQPQERPPDDGLPHIDIRA